MASSYSPLVRVELQAAGDHSNTWGDVLNTGFGLLESAIAGRATVAHDDTPNLALTSSNGAADQARSMFLNVTGALTAARNLLCPATSKLYGIKNATSGGFDFTLKTSGGTGVVVPNGRTLLVMCDGTNVLDVETYKNLLALAVTDLTLNGNLTLGASASLVLTSKDLTTITSGTVTPDPRARAAQHYVNGGAHTLAPSANVGSVLVDITNNASAGAITTSGFTFVTGDVFSVTNGKTFRCHISIGQAGSVLNVLALP